MLRAPWCPMGSQVAAVAERRRAERVEADLAAWPRCNDGSTLVQSRLTIVDRDPGDEKEHDPERTP